MAAVTLWTYYDALEHCLDYIGAGATRGSAIRDARRAVQLAYRELSSAHPWSYLWKMGRVNTVAHQSTGTIAYDHTEGQYERMVTISGGTWPEWAAYGTLLINNTPYVVAERKSNDVVTLSISSNPGGDLASGTPYVLFRDTYPLPCDFRMSYMPMSRDNWGGLRYAHAREWHAERTLAGTSVGQPRLFTILGDDNLIGSLAIAIYPAPYKAQSIDFLYLRHPRPLSVEDYSDGAVSVSANSTTVTGDGTSWSFKHVGAVIRFSRDATDLPTGPAGSNPFLYERTIMSVESSSRLEVDLALPEALSNVKYRISDPLDIEYGSMLVPFLRGCEKQMATARIMKDKPNATVMYRDALLEAKANDNRVGVMRGIGWEAGTPWRIKYQPLGEDD